MHNKGNSNVKAELARAETLLGDLFYDEALASAPRAIEAAA